MGFLLWACYSFMWYMLLNKPIVIIDTFISDHIAEAIKRDIEQMLPIKTIQEISAAITDYYPIVKAINVRGYASRRCTIQIKGLHPLCMVNDDTILVENGTLISRTFINPFYYEDLYAIVTPEQQCHVLDGNDLKNALTLIPYWLWDKYQLVWYNHNNILMRSSIPFPFAIRTSIDAIPHKRIEKWCVDLATKKGVNALIDVRFAHQIVISEKEGGLHGRQNNV